MTTDMHNKLVVLRGPSCAGKTTVAEKLFKSAPRRTVLIQQDHYRFIFNPAGGGGKPNSSVIHQMIEHNVSVSLSAGYSVVLDGILSERSYGGIIERIVENSNGSSFLFYFNVSLTETLRRRKTRKQASFGEAEMTAWYPSAHKLASGVEDIIPESLTAEEALEHVTKAVVW